MHRQHHLLLPAIFLLLILGACNRPDSTAQSGPYGYGSPEEVGEPAPVQPTQTTAPTEIPSSPTPNVLDLEEVDLEETAAA